MMVVPGLTLSKIIGIKVALSLFSTGTKKSLLFHDKYHQKSTGLELFCLYDT